MLRDSKDTGVGYRIEVSFLGGRLKLEESGPVQPGDARGREELRQAEEDLLKALRRMYELTLKGMRARIEERGGEEVGRAAAGRGSGGLLMSISEVAEVLGVGRSKAYELVRTGELPSLNFGRIRKVLRSELYRWLEERSGSAWEREKGTR